MAIEKAFGLFELKYSSKAKKFIKKCDEKTRNRIKEALNLISQSPFPSLAFDFKKISGEQDTYRIRLSSHRIIYSIYPAENSIRVIKIERRDEHTYRL